MAYTVRELAKISGVSVRTLHFYDEIGVLKPAYLGQNKYRYYEENQLFRLQQILFFRELGFELKSIQPILDEEGFDQVKALKDHRKALRKRKVRMEELLKTIDKTIARIEGEKKMKDREMFVGFDPKKQEEYETYIQNRFGIDNPTFLESKRKASAMKKADWVRTGKEWQEICKDMAQAFKAGLKVESPDVQKIVRRHCKWLKNFWTPNRQSYAGLGMGYTGFEWKKAFETYDPQHPKLALFMARAMEYFAEKELK